MFPCACWSLDLKYSYNDAVSFYFCSFVPCHWKKGLPLWSHINSIFHFNRSISKSTIYKHIPTSQHIRSHFLTWHFSFKPIFLMPWRWYFTYGLAVATNGCILVDLPRNARVINTNVCNAQQVAVYLLASMVLFLDLFLNGFIIFRSPKFWPKVK